MIGWLIIAGITLALSGIAYLGSRCEENTHKAGRSDGGGSG